MTTPAPGPLVKYWWPEDRMINPSEAMQLTSEGLSYHTAWYKAAAVERVLEQVVVMLEEHSRVLHCWMNSYAPELCDVEEVRKAQQYIFEQGGTLAFIARHRAEALTLLATLKGRTA